MMKLKSITARLTLFFSTASTLVLLVVGTLIGTLVDAHFKEQDFKELSGKLELVRHALGKVRTAADFAAVPQHLSDALIGHPDLSVAVLGPDHRAMFSTSRATFAADLLERPVSGNASAKLELMQWEQAGKVYRGIVAQVPTGPSGLSPATVALAIDTEHHLAFLQTFRHNLWLAIASGILLTIILGWVAAHRGLVPIRKMADMAKRISASHLGERLAPQSIPSELVGLAIAFNEMLARLEDSFRRLSDFSSDLAHELRTPISNLMTQTQVALSKERADEEYREILYSNLEEYERLARMIADMLFLAKADNGLIVPSSETIDLAREISELFGFYEAIADEQAVGLVLTGTGTVTGDRLMLRRAFGNLLSNAIRHTPRLGKINVIIRREAETGKIGIIFENTGESIPPEHLPRLFDRFYRVDSSRQKASDGAGLGLAITQSIIAAHKGSIQVHSAQGLTRFEISFPMPARIS